MIMRLDTYEQECKYCPSLKDCKDIGIGCYRVIPTDDTYSTGHNENETVVTE